MTKRPLVLIGLATALVLLQQHLLLQRAPRLNKLATQQVQSGTAALDLQFSRPMNREQLAAESSIQPSLSFRWLGDNNPLRLLIAAEQRVTEPIQLNLAGRDQRGQAMAHQTWWWDPRPWLVVTRQLDDGEQVQLQDRQGRWHPLTPIWTKVTKLTPLGDGQGIAVISSDGEGGEQIWLRRLRRFSLARERSALRTPETQQLELLAEQDVLFGHLSSNLNGDLLLQTGGLLPESERIELIEADGSRQPLRPLSSGPMELLPAGGGLVVPGYDSLSLQPLVDNGRQPQSLPGSRELGAFCAASGRAVLIRHWPDYRRSIELVIPGLAPRQLWLGEKAVLGVACDGSGKRIWAVLGERSGQRGLHTIVQVDDDGQELQRADLGDWSMKGGTPLQFDPVTRRLLLTVIQSGQREAYPALMDADNLAWEAILPIAVGEAQWLNP